MAENKKSFVLYVDWITTFEQLSDKEAGVLIKHLFKYVNDQNPKLDNRILNIAFEPIKNSLRRDLKKWEANKVKRSEAGKLGGIKSGESRRREANEANASHAKQNEANEAVSVSVSDSVSVKEGASQFFPIEHCLTIAMNDERWVRSNKASEKELHEFNKKLEGRGVYSKNPLDYKTHFHNWKASGKKDSHIPEQATAPKLKIL